MDSGSRAQENAQAIHPARHGKVAFADPGPYSGPPMFSYRSIGMILCVALGIGCAVPPSGSAQVRKLQAVRYAGRSYIALKDLAAMYGLPLVLPGGKALLIRGQYTSLQFTTDARMATINGCLVWLHAPIVKAGGRWSISDADAQFAVDPLVRPAAYLGARGARTIVLDAGHGGKDPGTMSGGGIREKDLTLDIALRTKKHLEAAGQRIVMTRDTDRFWELADRPYLAARGGGDVFVSIHLNSAASRSVKGVETFVTAVENAPPTAAATLIRKYPAVPNNQFNHSNTILGYQIQREVVNITRAEDRGLKRARFVVLRNSAMPAALVECGFLSNPQETQKLSTPSYRETLALGLAQGILKYCALVRQAKLQSGAPLVQKAVQTAAAPKPAAAAPPAVAAADMAAGAVPAAVPAASPPAVVAAPPVVAVRAPVVRPAQAIAPPPSKLLSPNLAAHPD